MSILPRPKADDRPPPVVEWLRQSRLYGWVRRHRTLSAAVTALAVAARMWKVAFADPLLALVTAAVVFVLAFAAARLGIDWLDRRVVPEDGRFTPGPAWADRPPDRATTHVPPRMG